MCFPCQSRLILAWRSTYPGPPLQLSILSEWWLTWPLSPHRLVLSSVSDYFAVMFTSDVREAKQDEVKMEGVDPDALWVLVQYAYTGKRTYQSISWTVLKEIQLFLELMALVPLPIIPPLSSGVPGRLDLREDTIESLLSASCLLQLSSVVQACCSFLMKQLHPSNCLGIRSYADAQGCHDLQRAAHAYTMVSSRRVLSLSKNESNSCWDQCCILKWKTGDSSANHAEAVKTPPSTCTLSFDHFPSVIAGLKKKKKRVHVVIVLDTIIATMAVFSQGLLWWLWNSSSVYIFFPPLSCSVSSLCAVLYPSSLCESVSVSATVLFFLSLFVSC